MEKNLTTVKQEVFDYVHAFLGGGMVDVELDPIHYEVALTKALTKYRQRTAHAVEESYITLELVEDQNTYILPKEILEVRQIFRASVGSKGNTTGVSGTGYDPFNLAYTNTYLMAGSGVGGLATYELYAQKIELMGRMFGTFIEFQYNSVSKALTIFQRPRGPEEVLLWCYNYRPDAQLLGDYLSGQWLKDYTLAGCKYMLGEARSKFATIAGPQGGTSLNGNELKAEAQQEMEKLELELANALAGGTGYSFLIG